VVVFAEARQQVAQFSWSCMIDAEFVDASPGLRRVGRLAEKRATMKPETMLPQELPEAMFVFSRRAF
jgi:hypothetical protein